MHERVFCVAGRIFFFGILLYSDQCQKKRDLKKATVVPICSRHQQPRAPPPCMPDWRGVLKKLFPILFLLKSYQLTNESELVAQSSLYSSTFVQSILVKSVPSLVGRFCSA